MKSSSASPSSWASRGFWVVLSTTATADTTIIIIIDCFIIMAFINTPLSVWHFGGILRPCLHSPWSSWWVLLRRLPPQSTSTVSSSFPPCTRWISSTAIARSACRTCRLAPGWTGLLFQSSASSEWRMPILHQQQSTFIRHVVHIVRHHLSEQLLEEVNHLIWVFLWVFLKG